MVSREQRLKTAWELATPSQDLEFTGTMQQAQSSFHRACARMKQGKKQLVKLEYESRPCASNKGLDIAIHHVQQQQTAWRQRNQPSKAKLIQHQQQQLQQLQQSRNKRKAQDQESGAKRKARAQAPGASTIMSILE